MHEETRARSGAAAASGDPRDPRDLHVGRLLDGRYRIGERVARGGMASVYQALDIRLDRTVAVKIMHPGLGDATTADHESFARRFVREAKAAARLSHPNVVAVYDQGEDADGTVYLVMEYVPGHTLRDTISREAPMSPERALAILDPVLAALGAAHRAGLVHRDVKPENVLIADDGRIKVADFGLARAVSADTQHTATNGVLIGTVSYLAPELVVEHRSDARADVYAAGVILYELLTGVKPHTGESPIAVAYKHVHEDVPAPSLRVPSIPAYVDALVARATTRDTSLRPTDATVLLHHMHRVAHALHAGVREDLELVDDLTPRPRPAGDEGHEATDELPDLDAPPAPYAPPTPVHQPILRDQPGADEAFSDWFREEPTSLLAESPMPLASPDEGRRPPRRMPPAVPVAPAAPRDRGSQGRRGKGVVLLVALALVVAVISGAGYWFGWGRYTSTPSVVGLQHAAAEAKLGEADLKIAVGEELYSETAAKGEVIGTDPGPGERILPGGTVTVTLSKGPERYDVPDLRGSTLAEAEQLLAGAHMVVGRQVRRFSETVPADSIITTVPAFGTKSARNLPVDTAVQLVVSKGRRPIKVGNWVGKDARKAENELERRGLQVKVTDTAFSDTVEDGDVISQSPPRGTLFKGDTVNFVVSKGPELVTVPAIRYLSTSEAVKRLEDAGFKVRKEPATIYINGNVAWSTDPEGGERIKKGSTVTLYVV